MGCRLAQEARVKNYCLFHHDPYHNDAFIDQILTQAQRVFPGTIAATPEMELKLSRKNDFKASWNKEIILPKKSTAMPSFTITQKNHILKIELPHSKEEFVDLEFVSKVTENITEMIEVMEINFENLQELDSISLGVFASFIEKAKDLNIVVKLYNVSEFIQNILTIARFIDAVELH